MESKIIYNAIGTIHTNYHDIEGTPIQPSSAQGSKGEIEVFKDFEDGLKDLECFSHIILIYHLHLSKGFSLEVIPFLDTVKRGLFSTRAPRRPNPIGISVVKLIKIKNNILEIENIDVIDGTPLLDIKPFVSEMDGITDYKIGWLSEHTSDLHSHFSDNRFK